MTTVQPAILPGAIFLLGIALALAAAGMPLHYQARVLELERSKQKRDIAKEIKRDVYYIMIPLALVCVIVGFTFWSKF